MRSRGEADFELRSLDNAGSTVSPLSSWTGSSICSSKVCSVTAAGGVWSSSVSSGESRGDDEVEVACYPVVMLVAVNHCRSDRLPFRSTWILFICLWLYLLECLVNASGLHVCFG